MGIIILRPVSRLSGGLLFLKANMFARTAKSKDDAKKRNIPLLNWYSNENKC